MKTLRHLALFLVAGALALAPLRAAEHLEVGPSGLTFGKSINDRTGFHGSVATQRAGSAQTALTDSTGGTTTTTLAAGVGVHLVTIPLTSLATGLSTSAIDLLTNYTPGFKFKILAFHFVTTVAGTGASASQTFNLEIGTTNVTGGSLNLLLADTAAIGQIDAATAITAANTGTASDTISIEMAAGGTVFTAGAGYFVIRLQNMDTADAFAGTTTLVNELRASLVEKGMIKGSN